MLERLSHPNICKLLEVCEDSQNIHLVLECLQGKELFAEISAQGPMKATRAACIMKQTFEALQYCHEHDVIHRDVKPENIMVTDSRVEPDAPHVHLIDFGLATTCRDLIHTPIVGTACYMAPEALREGIYSSAADMWSAGVVLYALLTGDIPDQFRPFGKLDWLKGLSTSHTACDLLYALLKFQPEERITASVAAQHAWTVTRASYHRTEQQGTAAPRQATLEHEMPSAESFDDGFAVFVDFDYSAKAPVVDEINHSRTGIVGSVEEVIELLPIVERQEPVAGDLEVPMQPTPLTSTEAMKDSRKQRKQQRIHAHAGGGNHDVSTQSEDLGYSQQEATPQGSTLLPQPAPATTETETESPAGIGNVFHLFKALMSFDPLGSCW